jgi:hypothetical protein
MPSAVAEELTCSRIPSGGVLGRKPLTKSAIGGRASYLVKEPRPISAPLEL